MDEVTSFLSQTYYESPYWGGCCCCCATNTNKSKAPKTNDSDVCLNEEKPKSKGCVCGKNVEGTPGEVCYTCYNDSACN